MAIASPTLTLVPSSTKICCKIPSAYDSNSTTALSVSISAIGSPILTLAPSSISHLTTTPSFMSYPIWGILSSSAN